MKKLLLVVFIAICASYTTTAQSDCKAKFSAADILKWRKELNFTPKYMTVDKMEYVISVLSDKVYNQMYIDMSVTCYDSGDKQKFISLMKYLWSDRVPDELLQKYFPAYYVFYQLDIAARMAN